MTASCRAAVLVAAFALLTSGTLNAQTLSEKGFYCLTSPVTWAEPGTPAPLVAGQLFVNWPSHTSTTSDHEYVYFMAVVYRWNPSTASFEPYQYLPQRANYTYPGTWYLGISGPNGQIALGMDSLGFNYWSYNGSLVGNPVIGLPKGYYKVGVFMTWQSGASRSTWATLVQPGAARAFPVGVKGGYCTI
jgi:hypothetical protein